MCDMIKGRMKIASMVVKDGIYGPQYVSFLFASALFC